MLSLIHIFAESDREKLIDIGLSYIPEDCAVARAIRKTVECYHNGIDYLEARKIVHNTAPGTFGLSLIHICIKT